MVWYFPLKDKAFFLLLHQGSLLLLIPAHFHSLGLVTDMKCKQALKLIIIIFSFLGIKAKRIPLASPQKPFFTPLIIFVTSLNWLQFHHICTLQAWVLSVLKQTPSPVLYHSCQCLRPKLRMNPSVAITWRLRLVTGLLLHLCFKPPHPQQLRNAFERAESKWGRMTFPCDLGPGLFCTLSLETATRLQHRV